MIENNHLKDEEKQAIENILEYEQYLITANEMKLFRTAWARLESLEEYETDQNINGDGCPYYIKQMTNLKLIVSNAEFNLPLVLINAIEWAYDQIKYQSTEINKLEQRENLMLKIIQSFSNFSKE